MGKVVNGHVQHVGNLVGCNSVMCTNCSRCSGIRDSLWDAVSFRCAVCIGKCVVPRKLGMVSIGDECLECVDEFCYIGDMISAVGWAEASSVTRV